MKKFKVTSTTVEMKHEHVLSSSVREFDSFEEADSYVDDEIDNLIATTEVWDIHASDDGMRVEVSHFYKCVTTFVIEEAGE